jgi:Flp pilus assembly protein TadB
LEENMERHSPAETATMTPLMVARARRAESFSTRQLLGEISDKASLLIKKEVELARNEIKADLRSQLTMAKGFAVAVVVALMALSMLPLALVFALAHVMPAWVAALAVAGGLLLIAAIVAYVSWQRRVTAPLALTRKTLKEDVQWAKERLA